MLATRFRPDRSHNYVLARPAKQPTKVYSHFLAFAGKLAAGCFAGRGWEATEDDGHLDTLLRAMGISMSLAYNQVCPSSCPPVSSSLVSSARFC